MGWRDYWNGLEGRERAGLIVGVTFIVCAAVGAGSWLLRDPFVPLGPALKSDQLNARVRELEHAKVTYRIADSGDRLEVPQSQLGKARAAMESGEVGAPPSVGLELFKETDFSTTDFAQRINYQRALQGELTRTVQALAGVRSARVHVILADSGLFKRSGAKARAAVTVALEPGAVLSQAQVRGIQRLVAASVPEIEVGDVVVLDETGTSLARGTGNAESDVSASQLDLKRQVDQYLEGKLQRLLQEVVPKGTAAVSVDAALDEKQLKVTTDEPLPTTRGTATARAAGVLLKERQSQHGRTAGLMQTTGDAVDDDSIDSEHEYVVGHRTEQSLSNPGSIKRVSVAVVIQGAPAELTGGALEQLVINALGVDRSRGDSVSVLLLPALPAPVLHRAADPTDRSARDGGRSVSVAVDPQTTVPAGANRGVLIGATVIVVLVAGIALLLRGLRPAGGGIPPAAEVAAATHKVRQWLGEGSAGGHP